MSRYRHSLIAFALATACDQEAQRQKLTGEDRVTDGMVDDALAIVLAECGESVESIGEFALMTMRDVQRRAIAAALARMDADALANSAAPEQQLQAPAAPGGAS